MGCLKLHYLEISNVNLELTQNPFKKILTSRKSKNYLRREYLFGFNGKEDDRETGTQDYGFRIYNPQLGKFLSVDPLTNKYPELTPYQFASNSPICGVDLDGLEFYFAADGSFLGRSVKGGSEIRVATSYHLSKSASGQVHTVFTNYKSIDKVSDAIARKIYTTIYKKEVGKYFESLVVNKVEESIGATTISAGNFTINRNNENYGQLLNSNYYNVVNSLIHEEEHSKHMKNGQSTRDGFTHFKIALKQISHSSWKNTTSEYKDFVKGAMDGTDGYLAQQSSYLSGLIRQSSNRKATIISDKFQYYLKEYNNNVDLYNTMFNAKEEKMDPKKVIEGLEANGFKEGSKSSKASF